MGVAPAGRLMTSPREPDLNRLLITLRNAMEKVSLVTETKILKKKIAKSKQIVGDSTPIQKIKETIAKVAPTEAGPHTYG